MLINKTGQFFPLFSFDASRFPLIQPLGNLVQVSTTTRWNAARTRDGHGRKATPRRALCRLVEVHAVWSALLAGGRVALASLHPATEPARMQEQARRRRHLKNPAPPFSSSAVQWRAVPEKLRRPIENRWT